MQNISCPRGPRGIAMKCASATGPQRAVAPVYFVRGRPTVHSKASKDDRTESPAKGQGKQKQQHADADIAPKTPTAGNGGNATKAADDQSPRQTATQVLQTAVKPSAGSAGWRPDSRVMFASKNSNRTATA